MRYIIVQQCYTRARSSANKQALNFPAKGSEMNHSIYNIKQIQY